MGIDVSTADQAFGQPAPRFKLWLALCGAALVGFLGASPYFIHLFRHIPSAAGKALPPLPVLFFAQLGQVLVLAAPLTWFGILLAPKAGFDAPLFRARLAGQPVLRRLAAELPRALLWGTLFSAAILLLNHFASPWLPEALRGGRPLHDGTTALQRLQEILIGASSAFYGGIIEELLLRWFMLSALAVLALKLGAGRSAAFWIANLGSALLFGAGHLPAAYRIGGGLGAGVVGYIVLANAIAGVVCGWLYRKRGLESAMLAHGWGDICLHSLPLLFA